MEFSGKTTRADCHYSPGYLPDPESYLSLLCLLHWLESSSVERSGKLIQYIIFVLKYNIRIYLEVNDNEHTNQQKSWETVKFVQGNDGNSDRL